MQQFFATFVLLSAMAFAQQPNDDGYPLQEALALNGDGSELHFRSGLHLKGEELSRLQLDRIYRRSDSRPEVIRQAVNGEGFRGAFLSTDGKTSAEYCTQVEGILRPITYESLCVNRDGERKLYRAARARLSRNGRFAFGFDTQPVLRDLETGLAHPLPGFPPLHGYNALSDQGALITTAGFGRNNTVAVSMPYIEPKLVFEGAKIGYAGISPDGRFVFLRDDLEDGTSNLIEVDLSNGSKHLRFSTKNDRFYFYISGDGNRVLIRYFQALSLWDRASGMTSRIADSPDFITSTVLSDDGNVVAYQRSDGSIHRISGPHLSNVEEIYAATPNLLTSFGRTTFPGSASFFASRGFNEETEITINGIHAPLISIEDMSIQSQELVLQVPWEAGNTGVQPVLRASNKNSPFEFQQQIGMLLEPFPGFYNYRDPAQSTFVATAALEDFSDLVSSLNPAPAGRLVHVYLGGLGPLDKQLKTGEAGPFDPPAKPLASIRCDLRNLDINSPIRELEVPTLIYAPGLVGVYQADLRIPQDWTSGNNVLRCRTQDGAADESRIFTRQQ